MSDQPVDGAQQAGGIDFLAHEDGDHVAVAVRDVGPGPAVVAWLSSEARRSVEVTEAIRFGHKVALADLVEGTKVVEYGAPVAVTTAAVAAGALVHTHNVRSAKWQHSG